MDEIDQLYSEAKNILEEAKNILEEEANVLAIWQDDTKLDEGKRPHRVCIAVSREIARLRRIANGLSPLPSERTVEE